MLKALFAFLFLIALAPAAFAQQIPPQCDLTWSDCPNGAFAANLNNSCTSNTGVMGTMVVSFVPPIELDSLVAVRAIIDFVAAGATIPPWWQVWSGGCVGRVGKIVAAADFTSPPFGACGDPWKGFAVPGFNLQPAQGYPPNWATIRAAAVFGDPFRAVVTPDQLWYAVSITILNAGTLPATRCPGCTGSATFTLEQVNLSEPAPIPDFILTNGPHLTCTYNGEPTATRASSWGSIKTLYR